MKKLNDSFENRWKAQFEDAEATPSASVWDRIDANMAGSEVKRYKKKLFYYQVTAAASILLALLFGSYILFNLNSDTNPGQLVQLPSAVEGSESGQADTPDTSKEQIQNYLESDKYQSGTTPRVASTENRPEIVPVSLTSNQDEIEKELKDVRNFMNENAAITYHLESSFNVPYEKPGRKYYLQKKENPFETPYVMPFEEEDQNEDPQKLWAGVLVSSGVFDPNINYNGSPDIMADASPNTLGSVERINATSADLQSQSNSMASYKPEESGYRSEMSVSYGLDFGYKFSKKFVFFSGVGYQHNFGSTSVNTYIEPTESHAKYANHAIVIERASPESGLNSYNELNTEVQLNSTFEFITIPVNFGYYLVDKKFKWLMTAGVSTDIFVKNSIDDSQNLFDPIQYKLGDDSPYNPVYFNGKFGTMLNYTFLRNYQFSLEPSYRIGLSELTNNNAAFSSRPSSFMISAGIAYVFK
jgi:hypothetical protein